MKVKIGLFLVFLFFVGIYFSQIDRTQKFDEKSIQFEFPYHSEWEIEPLNENKQKEIHSILSQKFTYLGKGARLISFLSEDGKYVLKFFKYRYHKPHWAVRFLPSIFPFENYKKKKMQKVSLETVLNGYKIAYDHDREGTGLIYLHLNPTLQYLPSILLIDKEGKSHHLPLENTRFVIQLKVRELEEVIHDLLKNGNVELAQKKLLQILELYSSHYQQGLFDLGVGILNNNGFIEDKPIHFDVSKMTFNNSISTPQFQKERIAVLIKKIDRWLLKNHPLYREEILKNLENFSKLEIQALVTADVEGLR